MTIVDGNKHCSTYGFLFSFLKVLGNKKEKKTAEEKEGSDPLFKLQGKYYHKQIFIPYDSVFPPPTMKQKSPWIPPTILLKNIICDRIVLNFNLCY